VNFLTAEHITKTYGEKVLFNDLSLHINKGQKVALVARNGAGKSTLLRVLSGQESPEGENAKLMIRRDIRLGILEQDPEFYGQDTVIEAVFDANNPMLDAIKEYETALSHQEDQKRFQAALARMEDLKAWDIEAKVKEILFKLDIQRLEDRVDILSGGQKKRLALAKLLIEEPDFLILDEPTNHLDLDMIEWLEEYLQQPNLTLLMVTHDRYFLDRVCDTMVELEGGQLYRYTGNYAEFLEKKANRAEVETRTLERDKKLFKKELEWVRRMPKARGTKAKARVDKFEDLKEKVSGKALKEEVQMDIKGARLGGKILELHSVCKAYDDLKIVDNFFYKFKKKERVGIVGPNGAGKTTFLKLLTQEIRPDHGKVVVGGTVQFGYFTQSGIQLKEDKRVIDVVRDVAEFIPLEKGQKLTAPQLLERFMFSRAQQQVYVSQLSGGERRRLHLLTILMTNPNFLILDEPTNDLDIITLNVLEEFLMDFPGCLVIVSHDRYFMDKIVDHLFIFEGEGKIRDFNGKYTEYRLIKKEEELDRKRQEAESREQKPVETKPVEKREKRKLSYHEQVKFKQLEKDIEKLESRKAEIFERFNDPTISSDEIETLSIEVSDLKEQLEEKELRWMELAEFA
jgi:ATP-binding cassette subfamily F protein uup